MVGRKFIALIFGMCLSSWAWAGSQSGGGGGTLITEPGLRSPLLLDLYLRATPAQKLAFTQGPIGTPLPQTPFLRQASIELLDLQGTEAFQQARQHVEARANQETGSGRLMQAVLGVLLHKLQLFYTYEPIRSYHQFYVPDWFTANPVPGRQWYTVIIYDQVFGPVIYAPLWNQLTPSTQAALLVHEALRYFAGIHRQALSEENIQDITAAIFVLPPEASVDLYQERYMGRPLSEALAKPFWTSTAEAVDGLRFRLYYRWVQSQLPRIHQEVADLPNDLREKTQELLRVVRQCDGSIHEAQEISCATAYAMIFSPLFKLIKQDEPRVSRWESLRLVDQGQSIPPGESKILWWYQGKPSMFYPMLYYRLFNENHDQVLSPEEDAALIKSFYQLPHPLQVRSFLNEAQGVDGDHQPDETQSAVNTVTTLFYNYVQSFIRYE